MMSYAESVRFAFFALRAYPLRTTLIILAVAVGVSAVVSLAALGDGARRFVVNEFSSLGTNLLVVLPGRSETVGSGLMNFGGETTRDLTLEDANALKHPAIRKIAPVIVGSANVSFAALEREVPTLGTTAAFLQIRHWTMRQGSFIPEVDTGQGKAVCVIGTEVAKSLFSNTNPVGQWLRVGAYRFRVIGVLASEGRSLGVDSDQLVVIPVSAAQQVFNTQGLFRILIEVNLQENLQKVKRYITETITKRHHENDVTIVTQDSILTTFDAILRNLTLAVAGIAAISLAVAGILVMNVMLVAVAQRTGEIGLLKALGASTQLVSRLFLMESALLTLVGAVLGVGLGWGLASVVAMLAPEFPISPPLWSMLAACMVSFFVGMLFGIVPARRAAKLPPVSALQKR